MWLLDRHMKNGWVTPGKSGPQSPHQMHVVIFLSFGDFACVHAHLHAQVCEPNAAVTPGTHPWAPKRKEAF